MWASGATLEGICNSVIESADWKESSDGSGGWLATGCSGGTVGISWISSPAAAQRREATAGEISNVAHREGEGSLYKSHFILRGHTGEVNLVRWMPTQLRLASHDSRGQIILWNNRANILAYEFQINTPLVVTDIQWSRCGLFLITCAKNGHITLFSGHTGRLIFSAHVESTIGDSKIVNFTCCSWNQLGTKVAFGTSNGEVVLLDPISRRIATRVVHQGIPIQCVEWNGTVIQNLSVYLNDGGLVFYSKSDSREYSCSTKSVVNGAAAWNSDVSTLIVIGKDKKLLPTACFLNNKGHEIFKVSEGLPKSKFPMRNVLWAFRGSVVMFSCGPRVYTLKVSHSLPSLESLCQHTIMSKMVGKEDVRVTFLLPLPRHTISQLSTLSKPLMLNHLDTGITDILTSLYKPNPHHHRLHCVVEAANNAANDVYILKLEHFNSYVPLLQTKRKPSKKASMRTCFIIEPAFKWHTGHDEEDSAQSSCCSASVATLSRSAARTRPYASLQMFNPVLSRRVMDAARVSETAVTARNTRENLVVAQVERSSVTNQFRFHTTSPLFHNGSLGSLRIHTNYIKCRPRSISVSLPGNFGEATQEENMVLVSRKPDWNENFRIYELDFGGRVRQDSIKNFQIEHNGQVVLQFGKVDRRKFCLDFQAPFSVVQAMCVALSCILSR